METFEELRALARSFIEREVRDRLPEYEAKEEFPWPLVQFQLVQEMLAEIRVDLEAARLLVESALRKKEAGERFTLEASMAKLFASEAANRAAYKAIQIHGGYGFFEEYEVARLYRDARITTLYEGTGEVQKLVIGAHLTGIRAFG